MANDALDKKLLEAFSGKVVRKDLLHRIKSGTNVPTFVLEFLLARFCASDDPQEIEEGLQAVIDTLQDNYVRPDEANAAQSKVATKGKYRFIDKVHVRYVEKEKRHWAALENFNSQRLAIADKFYKDNDRLLEGGIWAEVTVGYNEVEDDNYAFYIENLRPIQLSRFDFDAYVAARKLFTRDEWLGVILRSVGLEPSTLNRRQQFHYLARLASLVEPNYNFIELGPRGTGKSYFFSEFTPYSTLLSGGQATKSILFYNNTRKQIGLVGFWDTIAFDEVANIKIKDPDAMQIMKDYMANGRFSRGVEVIADASMSFVGNIDYSVTQVVNSPNHDLFMSLPKEFDFAIMDRFACYLPGWEMPKTGSYYLTGNYGFITDYLAEAFHYQFTHTNRIEEVNRRIHLGENVEGRDESRVKKTVSAFLKILHPDGGATDAEFEEYVAYALEARRRVKEQMNKRKPDDEFANINLSYVTHDGKEIIVYCPESKDAEATQKPIRKALNGTVQSTGGTPSSVQSAPAESAISKQKEDVTESAEETSAAIQPVNLPNQDIPIHQKAEEPLHPEVEAISAEPQEQHYSIMYGDTGITYESIFGPYLEGVTEIRVEDPYIRIVYQIQNFVRFCEAVLKYADVRKITLETSYESESQKLDMEEKLGELKQSLLEIDVILDIEMNNRMHDREISFDNGWHIKIGRGLDFFQKPALWYGIGSNDLSFRPCLETKVDIYKN